MKVQAMFARSLVLGMVVLCPIAARAAVIFNNGSPLLAPIPAQGALFAEAGTGFAEAADNFLLQNGQSVIRDIHWWGVYSGASPGDNFTINIYNDNAGTVGSLVTSANIESLVRTNTGTLITGLAMYSYDAVVSDIALAPLTNYWLGISNDSGIVAGNGWAWVTSANSGNARQYSDVSDAWGNSMNKSLAFNLTNTVVPEPSTYLLAVLGFAGVLAARRRTSRKPI